VIGAGLVSLIVGGCASSQVGNPIPADGVVTSGVSLPPAPPVPAPLSVAAVVNNACSLLSADQLQAMGFTAATTKALPEKDSIGVGCGWTDDSIGQTGAQIGVDLQTVLTHGLRDIYVQKKDMAYWQPVTVAGYPAVIADHLDSRPQGNCRMDLGVTDTDVLLVDYQGDVGSQPCVKVQALAAAVVRALKGGA
jgi:hypothetical protein